MELDYQVVDHGSYASLEDAMVVAKSAAIKDGGAVINVWQIYHNKPEDYVPPECVKTYEFDENGEL